MYEREREKYQIFNGDCLEIMKSISDKSIDLILCDLPYGTTRNKWDSIIPLDKLWEQYERIIKDNGAILLFAQTPFAQQLGASNLKLLKYEWIWDKKRVTGFLNSKKMPMKRHENILVFYKKLPTYNPQLTKGKPYHTHNKAPSTNYNSFETNYETKNDGWRFPVDIQEFSPETGLHPTQKPVALLEYFIKMGDGQMIQISHLLDGNLIHISSVQKMSGFFSNFCCSCLTGSCGEGVGWHGGLL